MNMVKAACCTLTLLLLFSCRSGINSGGGLVPGTHKRKTVARFNGLARSYQLHIPPHASEGRKPLVVVLHGAFSTARQMERETGFSDYADEEGFFVAYPNGIGIFGLLQHWNAGHCCGKAVKDGVDDVAYLDAVIDDVLALCPVDENRIYMVGHSNGGMMVYRYAAERAGRLDGAAVVSGVIDSQSPDLRPWKRPLPLHPVPMLILHGADDRIIPPEGGESPQKANGIQYASVFDTVEFWERHNGTNAPVQLVLLDGWGHDWPGPFFTNRDGVPEALRGYDAVQTIFRFFAKERQLVDKDDKDGQ